jgi:hypothetical protein
VTQALLATLPRATELIRAHMTAEAASGFARLRRIPSSHMIKRLDYFDILAPDTQSAWLDASAEAAARLFYLALLPRDEIVAPDERKAALLGIRTSILSQQFGFGLRYMGLHMRRALLNDAESVMMLARARIGINFVPRDDMPPHLVADPDPARWATAKAPQLRKLVDAAFKARFAATKEKKLGGLMVHTGVCEGLPLTVEVDYAARAIQVRYGITLADQASGARVRHFAYEQMWGAAAHWDYITEENAAPAVELLCDLVAESVRLFAAVSGEMSNRA